MKTCTLEQASRSVEIIRNAIDNAEDLRAKRKDLVAKLRAHWNQPEAGVGSGWWHDHDIISADIEAIEKKFNEMMDTASAMIAEMASTTIVVNLETKEDKSETA